MVCMRSPFDLIQSCEWFQKRGHGFAEEGTSKKKLATSPSPSSMAGGQASLSSSDLMLSCEGFQKHGYEFPTTHVSHRLLYTTGAESCLSDNGNATAAKDSLSNNLDLKNDDSLGNIPCYDDFLPLEDDSGDTLTHDDAVLPPKRYTRCEPLTAVRCFHEPQAMLQVFSIKLKAYLQAIGSSVDVYGFVAVRDGEDYHRNYLFNQPRTDPVTINTTSDYLPLTSPVRGMSMTFECLIEVDIRIKGDIEDVTLVDGCSDLIESRCLYDTEIECTMDDTNGAAMFDFIIFRRALEATIELNFTKVPTGGMEVKMCGYTAISKSLYDFMGEQRECDRFVTSAGKHPQYFIAAVPFEDTLFVDFMEGKLSIPFKAAVHGSQEREYHFSNGAVVSLTVSWSSTYY
ncbi:hypothetical protein TRIUR3_23260 [Triticum urartu]|uniref:DUF6598 domain-containing protein n=1 Tax=Triticum urartu TaxID=4572 RepID=M7ZR76_TRIUA|nr:hypothetical protein TRIUR3_23260 [Triticum urartu]